MPRLRAAEGGNSASDTETSSDDSDGEGGYGPSTSAAVRSKGLGPQRTRRARARVDDGDEIINGGEWADGGFQAESCIELPRCQLTACIPPGLAANLLVHAAVLQCSMC
jgi:hypothetical protein